MNKFAVAGAIAALAVAAGGSANASVQTLFLPGTAAPTINYTVIDNFNTLTGVTNTGTPGTVVLSSTTNGFGAQPQETPPPAVPYLDVQVGGIANISFAALGASSVSAFEFDWGSVDTYNHLTIHSSSGDIVITPPAPANGNQSVAATNGLFKVWGTAGETFSGITLTSDQQAFEIDDLAVHGVPEPASWAMMILGFGAIGFAMRRRNRMFAAV